MNRRFVLVAVVVGCWVAALGARLWHLQVDRYDHYRQKAADQQRRVLDLEPPRGAFYDSRGRLLAVSVEVETAYADPRKVESARSTAERLAGVLDVDADEIAERLTLDRDFVFVARKLDRPLAQRVRELSLPGIGFVRESKRYYPMRRLASQVRGFVGTDHKGLAGLEAVYDDTVAGRPGRRIVLRDAHRRTLLSPRLTSVEAEPGKDLHLTIDASIQFIVETELGRAVTERGASRGMAVALEPETGAVLAMASVPGFDPNEFADVPPERWRNPVVMDAFEPGSTFKMVTAAAAFDHRLVTPDDVLDCEMGSIDLAGQTIRDHHPFGDLTVRQVIAKSSNVGAIKLGLLLGESRLAGAIADFGFGRRTEIDLPGESPGIVRAVDSWAPLSKAYISFGQEVSVTALQLARAFATVANGGWLPTPHVVAAVGEPGGEVLPVAPARSRVRAFTGEVTAVLGDLLRLVVAEGTGRAAEVPGYPAAGKTGTAEKVVDGAYADGKYVASFAGWAPVDDPRIVIAVVLDEPWPAYHGGEVAAPAFAEMLRRIVAYWKLPPRPAPELDRPSPPEPSESPVVLAQNDAEEGGPVTGAPGGGR